MGGGGGEWRGGGHLEACDGMGERAVGPELVRLERGVAAPPDWPQSEAIRAILVGMAVCISRVEYRP